MTKAVRTLHNDLLALRKATSAEKKAEAMLKRDTGAEKNALASVQAQEKAIIDQFLNPKAPLDGATQTKLMNALFTLGESSVKTKEKLDGAIAKDKAAIANDKKAMKADRNKALKDLLPAEYGMSLKDTNRVRKELGLKEVKKAFTNPSGATGKGAGAIAAARSVFGRNIQDLKYSGPLARYLDKWPSSHVCCANFVSACLEKAGLMGASLHSDNVHGLSSNLLGSGQFKRVSSSNMQPGDVVCFNVPGEGPMAHVEMFEGYRNGQAIFIGSNNRNADGSQRICDGTVGYGIDMVIRHK
jgi:hypothetical protein